MPTTPVMQGKWANSSIIPCSLSKINDLLFSIWRPILPFTRCVCAAWTNTQYLKSLVPIAFTLCSHVKRLYTNWLWTDYNLKYTFSVRRFREYIPQKEYTKWRFCQTLTHKVKISSNSFTKWRFCPSMSQS